jgi:HYR domain
LNASYPKGTTTITWLATDASGNTSSKTQTVTINDTEKPVVTTAPNIVQSTDAGMCSAIVNITGATFTDNCDGGSINGTRSDGQPLNASYQKGTTTITWLATDASGNTSSKTQTVTVNDLDKPVIVAPDIVIPTTIAGSCSTVPVNYSGLTVTDNCPGLTYNPSIPSGSSFGFGTTQVLVTATDAAGNVSTKTFNVTVQKVATISGVTVTPNTQQYSDRVTFEAQLMPDACSPAGVPATTVTFFVGSQNMGTVPLVSSGGVLKGSLNTALLEPTPYGTAPTGQMAPGPHTVTAVFGGVDSDFIVSNPTTTLTITQEDARAYYTGALFASTSSASSSSATVTLSATIKDISSVDASDTNAGDIRNARVTFINRDTNTVIASNVPVGLVSAGDTTVGTATYNWNINIGSADSANYTVGVIVTNYYTRNASDDNSIVTVSKPIGTNFITGGGYLVLTSSSGLYFGEVGSKNNFGFNVKYNKGGTNLQGNLNVIVRNGGRVYQIKANSMTSLSVVSNKAIFNGKANIQDITDPLHPFSIDGNGSLQVRLTDVGQPGNTDTISITIWNKNGGVWFSSNWDGTQSVEQLLGGGNVVVR